MHNSFDFSYISTETLKNGDYFKIILYCNFGFLVNIITSKSDYQKIEPYLQDDDFDINEVIAVKYYKNEFHYFLVTP